MKKLILALLIFVSSLAAVPGTKPYFNGALTATTVAVSATGNTILGYNLGNPNATVIYLQVFDAATTGAVSLGTTAPTMSIAVPAYGVTDSLPTMNGVAFVNGIVIAATTTPTGSTAPTTAMVVNLFTN